MNSSLGLFVVPSADEPNDPAVLILRERRCLFAQHPAWTDFYRTLLGNEGLIAATFSPDERAAFEQTAAHAEIMTMLGELRRIQTTPQDFEPTRVVTVRLPKSLHESLRAEAHEKHTSMNKLCISKLLQPTDAGLVPSDF